MAAAGIDFVLAQPVPVVPHGHGSGGARLKCRGAGEITGVFGVLKVTFQWGLREGCSARSYVMGEESRGLQTVLWSARLPQENGAGDFWYVWVFLINETHENPAGHPGLGAVLEEGGFKPKRKSFSC